MIQYPQKEFQVLQSMMATAEALKSRNLGTASQLADFLGVPVSWVRARSCKSCPPEKRLPVIHVGARYTRFNFQTVLSWLQQRDHEIMQSDSNAKGGA